MRDVVLEALPHEYRQFREAVEALAKLTLQVRLFPPSHPSVDRMLGAAFMRIDALLQTRSPVSLFFSNGVLCWLNFEIDLGEAQDKAAHLLRESLVRHSVGEIELLRGTAKEEIALLALLLASGPGKDTDMRAATAAGTLPHVRLRNRREAREQETSDGGGTVLSTSTALVPVGERRQSDADVKMGKVVRELLGHLEKLRSREGSRACARIVAVIEREGGRTRTVLLLNSLQAYDEYTFAHSVNVAVISAAISRILGLGEDFVEAISHAALLHDIGKIYVPREIIHKGGLLTPSEWQTVRRHPVDGERILREEGFDLMARRVAYEHHMRHDLTGYPTPKEGYATHRASEIVRIADSYDALTTRRPYRRQISPYEAVKLMEQGSGSEFDPGCFAAFMRVLGNVPIGSLLTLDTGETALVVDVIAGSDDLPRVRLLTDAAGAPVEGEIILDLNELDPATGKPARRVARIVDQPVRDVEIGQYIAD